MGRRRKRGRSSSGGGAPKKPSFSNRALGDLSKSLGLEVAQQLPDAGRDSVPLVPSLPQEDDDDQLFEMAVGQPAPIEPALSKPSPSPPPPAAPDDEDEVMALLDEMVARGTAFEVRCCDEYIAGSAPGAEAGTVDLLRRGGFSVQAHLDLHGLTVEAAREEVLSFLRDAVQQGHGCVLLVHGRGKHSPHRQPILKERLATWLGRGEIGRLVLAFASARPCDGGPGATYVLLR